MKTRRPKSLYRLRMTRLGIHFLFVALFAMVGGSLRGFNLLLILAGLLVSVLVVQWRQARGIIRKTLIQREEPSGGFVNHGIRIRYVVTNARGWLPIWMIRIEDQVTLKRLTDGRKDADDSAILVTSVGAVRPRYHGRTSIVCRFTRRGRYQLGPLVASTGFPFSLMSCERLFRSTQAELFVYPAVLDLRHGWESLLPVRRDGDGQRMTGGADDQGEFFGLRHWQSGDRVKQIHWRTTARIGEPAVKKFEKRSRHQICLIIDGAVNQDAHSMDSFEIVLRMASTLVVKLAQQTQGVGMVCIDALAMADTHYAAVIQSEGREVTKLLQRLALAEPLTDAASSVSTMKSLDPMSSVVTRLTRQLTPYDLVVISSRKFSDVYSERSQTEDSESVDHFWRQMKQHGRFSWIDVCSKEVQHYASFEQSDLGDSKPQSRDPEATKSGVGAPAGLGRSELDSSNRHGGPV